MLRKYEPVSYELLRPEEIKAGRDACPIVYVVCGSLEWHSFHLPTGTDSIKAHAVCCEAALRHGGLVLPPFNVGLHTDVVIPPKDGEEYDENWGPEGWTGYTLAYNTRDTFAAAMTGVVRALVRAEWRVVVGVTGHDVGVQRDALDETIKRVTAGTDATGFGLMEGELYDGTRDDIPFRMDHAAVWETSCMMYAAPDSVDMEALARRGLCTDDRLRPDGPEGMLGPNPVAQASAELGRRIIETMGDTIGRKAADALNGSA